MKVTGMISEGYVYVIYSIDFLRISLNAKQRILEVNIWLKFCVTALTKKLTQSLMNKDG